MKIKNSFPKISKTVDFLFWMVSYIIPCGLVKLTLRYKDTFTAAVAVRQANINSKDSTKCSDAKLCIVLTYLVYLIVDA